MDLKLNKTILVTGHYGSGKTNFSLNLAMNYRAAGRKVVLADLDIVNPYFRSSDFGNVAAAHGIELVASDYAGSSLDIPALTGRLDAKLGGDATLIIDVGGDAAGAMALGRYATRIQGAGYSMVYVVSAYRYLVRQPEESVALLREIEAVSRLRATHIVNNSNLGTETTAGDILASIPYAQTVAELTGLPLACTVAKRELVAGLGELQNMYPAQIYVTAPWNEAL